MTTSQETQFVKWQYKAMDSVIEPRLFGSGDLLAQWMQSLNDYGEEGWELVSDSIIYTVGRSGTQRPILLFKRPVQ